MSTFRIRGLLLAALLPFTSMASAAPAQPPVPAVAASHARAYVAAVNAVGGDAVEVRSEEVV